MDSYLHERWKQQKECLEKEYALVCKQHQVLQLMGDKDIIINERNYSLPHYM